MKNFIAGKCPNCGANLQLDNSQTEAFCSYCGSKIIVEEAVEKLNIELSGKIEVDGINSINKLYKNAESYLKLQNFNNAFDTYCTIIDDNPEELEAYKGALISASNNMQRCASFNEAYPSSLTSVFNTYLDYMKKLDTNSKYSDFINEFSKYFEKISKDEENLALCNNVNILINNLRLRTNDFKNISTDFYGSTELKNDYNNIMNTYNRIDDSFKYKVNYIEDLKKYYEKAQKKQGFFNHGIGLIIKWYFLIAFIGGFVSSILAIIFN